MLFLCTSKTNTKSTLAPKATLKRSLAHYPNDLMGVKPKYNSVTLFLAHFTKEVQMFLCLFVY